MLNESILIFVDVWCITILHFDLNLFCLHLVLFSYQKNSNQWLDFAVSDRPNQL